MADIGNPISPEMIRSILSKKGGADTPENIMSIKNFIASNPQQAERYAMGMRGSGNEDNMDILQLEKQMDKTNGIATPAPTPDEVQSMPQGAAPAPRVATAPAAPQAPMQGPQLPMASGKVNPVDGESPQGGAGGDGGGLWPLVLAILGGGTAASVYANRGSKNPSGAERNANIEQMALDGPKLDQKRIGYEPKLTDQSSPKMLEDNMSDLSRLKTNEPAPTTVTNSPELNAAGKTAQLKSEVDAENEASNRLMEQMAQRRAGQASTADLLKRARGATGRR